MTAWLEPWPGVRTPGGPRIIFLLAALLAGSRLASAQELIATAFSLPADAPPLFLIDSQFDDLHTRLLRVDPTTGAMTLLADLGTQWTPVLGLAAADALTFYATGTDNSGSGLCGGDGGCILIRITLPVPTVDLIGPVRRDGVIVQALTGLTFGSDGRLYALSQETDGVYVIDTTDASATLLGTLDIDVLGGDLTFAEGGRLWTWSNLGPASGLYEIQSDFAHASTFALFPSRPLAGLSAPGHGTILAGASAAGDLLYLFDLGTGLGSAGLPLSIDGVHFDFKRGDLDSPWCSEAAACDDADLCTADTCTPGGCLSSPIDTDGDRVPDCRDRCPATPPRTVVDRDGCTPPPECPCDGPWRNHGEYVSCVAKSVARLNGAGRGVNHAGRIVREAARSSCGR